MAGRADGWGASRTGEKDVTGVNMCDAGGNR